jgi:hypothetical protein
MRVYAPAVGLGNLLPPQSPPPPPTHHHHPHTHTMSPIYMAGHYAPSPARAWLPRVHGAAGPELAGADAPSARRGVSCRAVAPALRPPSRPLRAGAEREMCRRDCEGCGGPTAGRGFAPHRMTRRPHSSKRCVGREE